MSSALDHFLNALDIALKAGDRASAERQDQVRKKRTTKVKGFGEKRDAADPSCCIVKREPGGTEP